LKDGESGERVLRIDKVQPHPQLQSHPSILIGIVAANVLSLGIFSHGALGQMFGAASGITFDMPVPNELARLQIAGPKAYKIGG
jgi:hypothetical protein